MDATTRRTKATRPGSDAASGIGETLTQALKAFARVDHDRELATDKERLEWLRSAQQLARQTDALYKQLVAEADDAGSSMRLHGTPTTSWLALDGQTSTREASGIVHTGKHLNKHPEVKKQALSGQIAVRQATAISKVMAELPPTLNPEQVKRAEELLLIDAEDTPADILQKSTAKILDQIRPPETDKNGVEDELMRLAEQQRRAHQRRHLTIWEDNDGSTQFKGSLPTVEAEAFRRLIATHVESDRRRGRDQADPRAETRTPGQRQADALIQLVSDHHRQRRAPGVAGDRPRVVVVMQEESLRQRAEQAGQLINGELVTAGELRRFVCDAELAPVVLGGASEILDVGRDHRLITPQLRRALSGRDGSCQFPGCQTADEQCEAHHIQPWWAGGATSLENLVLLCPHHHKLVEPSRFWANPGADSWQVQPTTEGRFEFLPPARMDPERKPVPSNATKRGAPHNRATKPRPQGWTPPVSRPSESAPPETGPEIGPVPPKRIRQPES